MKFTYTCLCLLLIVLTSCSKDEVNTEEMKAEVKTRTTLAYIVADNNLNSYAQEDVDEMIAGYAQVTDTENNNLLIYIDDYSTPRLLHVKNDGTQVVVDTLYNYEEQNSLNIAVMSGVINSALGDFEADDYGLIFWSHANGWLPGSVQDEPTSKAFGEDVNNDVFASDGVQMDILDLKTALEATPHFNYILFDACDMQSIEVAYELRYVADNFISSPSEIPTIGGYYNEIVPALFSKDDTANTIAQAYFNFYKSNYALVDNEDSNSSSLYDQGISISVIASKYLEDLAYATNTIITQNIAKDAGVATNTIYSYDNNYYNFYYDLDSFIKTISSNNQYQIWSKAYNKVVTSYLTTDYVYSAYADDGYGGMYKTAGTTGVTTYIPGNTNFLEASYWQDYLKEHPSEKGTMSRYQTNYNNYYSNYDWYIASGWANTGF